MRLMFILLSLSIALATPSHATLIGASLVYEVTAVDSPVDATFDLGDRFTIEFSLEDTTPDTNVSASGSFLGLLTAFSVSADPANTGSWLPTGVFDLGAASNYVTNSFGNSFALQVRGAGFPQGGLGVPFRDIDLNFNWLPGITDPGGPGLTFADHLGVPFDIGQTTDNGPSGIRFVVNDDIFQATLQRVEGPTPVVPEPSTAWLLALGLATLARRRT